MRRAPVARPPPHAWCALAGGRGVAVQCEPVPGHSSVDFTARVYGHVLETSARDDAARFAAYREGTETGRVIPFRAATIAVP